ncbi:hypothetical protein [Geminicoccus roseus]|uniref:hypothetical protein n=1 Tax=Geminicoccus roseus TaxID=404900 RepID=UPI00040938FB|nr:hypothetical protein [Geminicoccus roseus]
MSSSTASRAIALFGTEEKVDPPRILRAGPLTCAFEAGNLRYIQLGGREAIRAISMIVRDRNWGTYAPEIRDLVVNEGADGFSVRYRAVCSDGEQSFAYQAEIDGRADGSLVFAARGEALTDFVTNRAGFVVLHGVEGIVGQPVEVEHVDGSTEQSRFPELIDPVQPFKDIRALTHEVFPGVRVTCRMEGDAYEMEDQRNWMDASYKTYIRPLALPWPYTLAKGDVLDLKVSLAVEGSLPEPADAQNAGEIEVEIGAEVVGTMPKLALVVPAHLAALALDHADILRKAPFPVHAFSLLDGVTIGSLDTTVRQLEAFGALGGDEVERLLEAVLPCRDAQGVPTDDPTTLARDLDLLAIAVRRSGVTFQRIALSPACDLKSTTPGGTWPKAPSFEAIAAGGRAAFPTSQIGGGFYGSFTELNRKRPPEGLFDFAGHAIFPTVHAADDVSATEGLEALPSILESARAILGGELPYILYPTALSMRHNPYGAAPAENPRQGRVAMARVDPRERGVFAAAWYAGLMAGAAAHGLDTLCLAAAVGPSGIALTRQPHPQPWVEEADAPVVPSWHVLAGHAALAGGKVRAAHSSVPRAVQALAVEKDGLHAVWLCNLTQEEQVVRLHGMAGGEVAVLGAAQFEQACQDPDLLARARTPVENNTIRLDAYAVSRIEIRR